MMNFATGNMGGTGGMDPWSDNNSIHRSLGGMYQFGNTNSNMPGVNTMFGPDSQIMYSRMNGISAMQPYRSREYTSEDYGLLSNLKAHVFGVPLSLGRNREVMNAGFHEQSALFSKELEFNAAQTATSAGFGVAGIYAGGLVGGLATGGVGLAAGALISKAKDTWFDNYRRTSSVAGVTNKFVSRDGSSGASVKDNVDFTKFLGSQAADDPLLNIQDMTNVMNLASTSGLLNSSSNISGAKRKMKQLTKTLKDIADLTGSSDLVGLMSQIKKYSMMGISQSGAKKIIGGLSLGAQQAGMSRKDVVDFNNMAMMSANSQTRSAYTIASASNRSVREANAFRQILPGSGRLNDDKTYLSSAESAEVISEDFMGKTYNVSGNKKAIYAHRRAEMEGGKAEDYIHSLNAMPIEEQSKEMQELATKIKDKSVKGEYLRAMTSESTARSVVSGSKELSSIDTGSSVKELSEMIVKLIKDSGQKVNKYSIGSKLDDLGLGAMDSATKEYIVNKTKIEGSPILRSRMSKASANAQKQQDSIATMQTLNRQKERTGLGYKAMQLGGHIANAWRNLLDGGNYSAAKNNALAINNMDGGRLRNLQYGKNDRVFTDNVPLIGSEDTKKLISFNGIMGKEKIKVSSDAISKRKYKVSKTPLVDLIKEDGKDVKVLKNSNLWKREMEDWSSWSDSGRDISRIKKYNRIKISARTAFNNIAESEYESLSKKEKKTANASISAISEKFGSRLKPIQIKKIASSIASGENIDFAINAINADASSIPGKRFKRNSISKKDADTIKGIAYSLKNGDINIDKMAKKGVLLQRKSKNKIENEFISKIKEEGASKALAFASNNGLEIGKASKIVADIDDATTSKNWIKTLSKQKNFSLSSVPDDKNVDAFMSQSDKYKEGYKSLTKTLSSITDSGKRKAIEDIVKKRVSGKMSLQEEDKAYDSLNLNYKDRNKLQKGTKTLIDEQNDDDYSPLESLSAGSKKEKMDIQNQLAEKMDVFKESMVRTGYTTDEQAKKILSLYTSGGKGKTKEEKRASIMNSVDKYLASQKIGISSSDLEDLTAKGLNAAEEKKDRDKLLEAVEKGNKSLEAIEKHYH